MGQKSDIVHADRLKPYRSPSKHSIRNTAKVTNKNEEQKEEAEDTQDTEELIEQLQGFLRPDTWRGKKKPSKEPKQKPKQVIARHRRRKGTQEYWVHKEGKEQDRLVVYL